MANEITVTSQLQVLKGNLQYVSRPNSIIADLATDRGYGPGAVVATTDGVDISLAHLGGETPGWCWIQNLDDTNDVTLGRWDQTNQLFYPVARFKPGEGYPIRLAADVDEEYTGTSSEPSANVSTLRLKASNAPCNCQVHLFGD